MVDHMNQYILITPCKNEEKSLPIVIGSITKQSILPELWIIVDDGSNDKTPQIIQEAKNQYKWIKSLRLSEKKRDLTIHISNVIKNGSDFAINHCKEHNIKFDYIAFLDADMILSENFFDELLYEFEKDNLLGIASGEVQFMDDLNNLYYEQNRNDTISGGEMICKYECYEDIGGIPISFAWESVLRVNAILKGWKVKRFDNIMATQTRETSSAEGIRKGYYIKGTTAYYLNYNPVLVIVKGLSYCFKKPYYIGFVYLYGYFRDLINQKEQTHDKAIKNYFYWSKPREILQYYFNIFMKGE